MNEIDVRKGHRATHFSPVPEPLSSDATRAMKDALTAIARDIPDPKRYAFYAPLWIVDALLSAYRINGNEWTFAAGADLPGLRQHGLCGFGTSGLTAFAIKVRRVLKEEDA